MPTRRRLVQGLGAAAAAAALGCRGKQAPPGPLAQALLQVAAEGGYGGTDSQQAARRELAALGGRLRQDARVRSASEALRKLLFQDLGFTRVVENLGPRHALLPPVLADRRGSCVGLGSLYLALAEAAGIDAWGVLVPGHFFVQAREPGTADTAGRIRTAELLRAGEEMPERWYRDKYGVPTPAPAAYLRPLTADQVVAVVRFNLGNHHREAGRLDQAAAAYTRALEKFPTFPEAHASLGLTHHLQGQKAQARAAYERARALHPTLPGLERNLAALEAAGPSGPAP